jgi:hypothetical protein
MAVAAPKNNPARKNARGSNRAREQAVCVLLNRDN